MAMSTYVAPASNAPRKMPGTNRGSAAFKMASHPCAAATAATSAGSVASTFAATNLPWEPNRSTTLLARASSMSANTTCS